MGDPRAIIAVREGIGYIIVWPPIACACGRMASFVINRDGQTRCLVCAAGSETDPNG